MNISSNFSESSVELIMGPMYCGKTTELLTRLTIYNKMNLRVLYVNSILDTRTTKTSSWFVRSF